MNEVVNQMPQEVTTKVQYEYLHFRALFSLLNYKMRYLYESQK